MKRLDSVRQNSCQEGENEQIPSSDCEDGKYKVEIFSGWALVI